MQPACHSSSSAAYFSILFCWVLFSFKWHEYKVTISLKYPQFYSRWENEIIHPYIATCAHETYRHIHRHVMPSTRCLEWHGHSVRCILLCICRLYSDIRHKFCRCNKRKFRLRPTELVMCLQFTWVGLLYFWIWASKQSPMHNFLPLATYTIRSIHNMDTNPYCPSLLFLQRVPWPHCLQLKDYSTLFQWLTFYEYWGFIWFIRPGKSSGLCLRLERCKTLQCSYGVAPNNKDDISPIATLRSGECLNEVKDTYDVTTWPLELPSDLNYSMIYDLMILGNKLGECSMKTKGWRFSLHMSPHVALIIFFTLFLLPCRLILQIFLAVIYQVKDKIYEIWKFHDRFVIPCLS